MSTNITRRSLLAGLVLAPVGLALGPLKAWASEISASNGAGKSSRSNYFPNFVLQTQDGSDVHFFDDLIKGKTVLINFFYAKCQNFCPPQTKNLVKVQNLLGDRLGREVFMYSLTLKPAEDTPEVLREYAEGHGVKPGWKFLTGNPQEMEILRRKLGFADREAAVEKETFSNVGVILYGNESRNLWSVCPALTNPDEIIKYVSRVVDPSKAVLTAEKMG
jgi:protein SCO1